MLRDLFSLFPAYAGVILCRRVSILLQAPFPRIRGGDPLEAPLMLGYKNFSPHTRG